MKCARGLRSNSSAIRVVQKNRRDLCAWYTFSMRVFFFAFPSVLWGKSHRSRSTHLSLSQCVVLRAPRATTSMAQRRLARTLEGFLASRRAIGSSEPSPLGTPFWRGLENGCACHLVEDKIERSFSAPKNEPNEPNMAKYIHLEKCRSALVVSIFGTRLVFLTRHNTANGSENCSSPPVCSLLPAVTT